VADVNSGAYPEDRHIVHMDPDELTLFMKKVDAKP
jgi:3-methyl-2-oxobutanoate hydroxymethyltransferase